MPKIPDERPDLIRIETQEHCDTVENREADWMRCYMHTDRPGEYGVLHGVPHEIKIINACVHTHIRVLKASVVRARWMARHAQAMSRLTSHIDRKPSAVAEQTR